MAEGRSSLAYEGGSRRRAHSPSLSVIVLSEGTRDELSRALASIEARCTTLGAEVIVVRQEISDHMVELNASHPGVIFLDAPKGSSSAAMREAGIGRASGDILALRMDGAVGDGRWLHAFDATMNADPAAPRESSKPIAPIVDDAIAARRTPASAPLAAGGRDRRSGASEAVVMSASAVAVRDDVQRGVRHQQ